MNPMTTAIPTRKVMASTIGAAVATILVFAIEAMAGIGLPDSVAGAVNVIAVFVFGYYTPPAARDRPQIAGQNDPALS